MTSFLLAILGGLLGRNASFCRVVALYFFSRTEEEGTDLRGIHREPSLPTHGARKKNGGPMEKKFPCLSNFWPMPRHDKHHPFANIPSSRSSISSPHLPMTRFAWPCHHARRPLAFSRLLQPHQRGGKPTSARCSRKHPSTPPIPAASQVPVRSERAEAAWRLTSKQYW